MSYTMSYTMSDNLPYKLPYSLTLLNMLQVTAVLVAQLRRSFAAYGVANVAAGAQQDGQGPGQEDENKRQQQKQQEREGEGDGGGGEWARGGAGGRGAAGGPKVATSRQRLREVVAELNQVRVCVSGSSPGTPVGKMGPGGFA